MKGGRNNHPSNNINPDKIKCFLNLKIQYTQKMVLAMIKKGTAKLATEKTGTVLGDTKAKK